MNDECRNGERSMFFYVQFFETTIFYLLTIDAIFFEVTNLKVELFVRTVIAEWKCVHYTVYRRWLII